MSDYSDLIFLTAAMVIFGMLTINTAKSFQVTTDTMVRADLEYRAIATAQDEIDDIRWLQSKHQSQDPFKPSSPYYIYDDNPVETTIKYGNANQYSEDFIIYRGASTSDDCTLISSSDQRCYEILITVENYTVTPPISVSQRLVRTLTFGS